MKQDLAPNVKLVCITDHPGFNPVCFQNWSPRQAADKYIKEKIKQNMVKLVQKNGELNL